MYRHYRLQEYHRCRDVGDYNVAGLVEDHKECLHRSSQEYLPSKAGGAPIPTWTAFLLELSEGVFCYTRIKNSGYSNDTSYELVVVGPTPQIALHHLTALRDKYRVKTDDDFPGFFLLSGSSLHQSGHRGTYDSFERVPLRDNCLLDPQSLELHYGSESPTWTKQFLDVLGESGLSILRGDPGTGKTSFLRHVIASCMDTHRFYYVPPEGANILVSAELPELWKEENNRYPNSTKVLVIEDAENLLLERQQGAQSAVSSILNLTDGFMGDMVRVHIICTLNCDVASLDEAVLRPGRQRFYREFQPLEFNEAKALADHLGIKLPDEARPYTLAELYHFEATQRDLLTKDQDNGPIGFST